MPPTLKFAAAVLAAVCSSSMPTLRAQAPVPYSFRNAAIVAGGFITGIVPHPSEKNLMYLRTDIGGAYRWDAAQQSWTPLTDWVGFADNNLLGIESIAIDPTNADKLYLAAGTYDAAWAPNGAILRSEDRGAHFEVVNVSFKMGGNQDGREAGERLAVDPNAPAVLFLGTRQNGLWKSADGAKTWARVTSFDGMTENKIGTVFVVFDASTGRPGTPTRTLYAGVSTPGASLLRSSDAGATWSPVPDAPSGLLPNHGQLGADGMLYVTYGDRPGPNEMKAGAVWRLDTKAGKWKDISPEIPAANGNATFGYGSLAVDKRTVMVATMDRWSKGDELFRSTDAGVHWTNVGTHAERDPTLTPYIAGEDGRVALGHWIGAIGIDPFDPDHALYGTGVTVWATHDLRQIETGKTSHWAIGASGIEETAVITLVSPPKGPHLISGLGDIGCFRHVDLTVSPRTGALKNPSFSNCDSIDFAAADPDVMVRSGRTWAGSSHGAISTDNGATWTPFAVEPLGSDQGGHITIAADGSVIMWVNRKHIVGKSVDRGQHWMTTDKAPPRAQIEADRIHPARFYLYDPGDEKDPRKPAHLFVGDGPKVEFTATRLQVPSNGKMRTTPTRADDLWIASNAGLWHASAGPSSTIVKLPNVQEAYALGFGAPPTPEAFPTLFLSGKVDGRQGIFRSSDTGASWQRIDDDQHHFGWIGNISGDARIPNRVYLGTNGRGVIVGDPRP